MMEGALGVLGLSDLPAAIGDLKRAFRNAMMLAHPDRGGSNEKARFVIDAFNLLKETTGIE